MVRIDEGFPSQVLVRMPMDSIARMEKLPLCRALYLTDIGHYPEAFNHYVSRPQGCPNHIFIYCLSGAGWCQIGASSWRIGPGQAIVIPADASHAYGSDDERSWRIHWLHFNGSESADLLTLLSDSREKPIMHLPRPESIVAAFDDTLRWTQRSHTVNTLIALSGACARLLGLVAEGRRATEQRTRLVEERIRLTIKRMRETLRQPLTLEQLAGEACLSIPHYCALFKKQTGSAPMQLYTQMRIQLACELLHDTRLPVKDIAEATGYQDAFYFSRAFKKSMGNSPSGYRDGFDSGQNRFA